MTQILDVESLLQALGEGTRLRLLSLLAEGEICVCFFVESLGEPQSKISRHLAYLRNAGLVSARRDGKWVHYALTKPAELGLAGILEAVLESVESLEQTQSDRRALARACCSPRVPDTLKRAPKPDFAASEIK